MENKFEHLKNGLTKIYCEGIKTKDVTEIYIDTLAFPYAYGDEKEWKVYRGERYDTKEIKSHSDNKKLIREIGENFFGKDFRFSLVNGDYTDLRLENIYAYPRNISGGRYLRNIKQNLKAKQRALAARINDSSSLGDIQVIKYHGGLLLIEDYMYIKKLEDRHLNALKNYYFNEV
ncbi:MAG: hypothetical protein ABS949_12060 [Solibacillus sp.]